MGTNSIQFALLNQVAVLWVSSRWECFVMGRVSLVVIGSLVLAGCQGFPAVDNASAAQKPVAGAPAGPSSSKGATKAPQSNPVIVEVPTPLPLLKADGAAVTAGIVLPPLADNDARAPGFFAEKAQVDQLILQGSLTREAGAKRLYRYAVKEGISKGKADEDFWASLIQTYRNVDDRYISAEDAAADINAAASRRAAAK